MQAAAIPETPHLASALELSVGQYSVAGRKPDNEDAIGIRIPGANLLTTKGAAAVICDGVSAAEAGQEASQTSVTNFLSDYFSTPETWPVTKSAAQVITALNRWLYGRGRSYMDNTKGYVCTFSALVLKSQRAHLFHVGDSRIYRLRDSKLEQLTTDHSIPVSDDHAYLARAIGLDVRLDVDYQAHDLQPGDTFLLTTDGIHDTLPRARLEQLLSELKGDLSENCKLLADEAYAAGSTDNLSCQLLRVDHLPSADMETVVNRLTELDFPPPLKPGMILDGYRIERELYAGNHSQAHLVEDIESGNYFCMKTPSVIYEGDSTYTERFIMESWIGSRINSPYVVKVLEQTRSRSCLYYLTEYVRGTSLSQWMREHPRPAVEEAVYLIDQIAKGIRAFHRRETLHQGIKPENILIDHNGQVKIIDFSSCHIAGISEAGTPLRNAYPLGATTYSAPEYTIGKPGSYTADQFSLAVISYEMFTGKRPFNGKLEKCKNQRHFLNTRYAESFRVNPLVPHWIDDALKKALRYDPDRRHADVMEFVHELKHPNPKYLEYHHRPLMERDPLTAWKTIAGLLGLTQLITLVLLLR